MLREGANGSGHFLAGDVDHSERIKDLSLEDSTSLSFGAARRDSLSQTGGSLRSLPSNATVIEHVLEATPASPHLDHSQDTSCELPDVPTHSSFLERTATHTSTPSWEEKGKSIRSRDEVTRTPPPAVRPKRRPGDSRASSIASSPRSADPGSSSKGTPTKRGGSVGVSPYASPDLKSVTSALSSKSADAQIRTLKKLRFDVELCRCLAEDERGTALLVGLAEPARSWLPTFGCTDVQTTAAAALGSMAKIPAARKKISSAGGIPALVHILNTGSPEAQNHAAMALATLALDSSLSFQVGQAGGCAPLVRMLTSATALHSSFASFQMSTDHEEAQANAAAALASLAAISANKAKVVEAGGIAPLVLLLSSESTALQASAARCLHSLADDEDIAAKITESGAVETLLDLLESEEPSVQAAAAEAVGVTVSSERVAATAIPHLVTMLAADSAEVRIAGANSLANMAHNSTINKVKTAGELGCIMALVQQLHSAEVQLKLAARLNTLRSRLAEAPLLALLEGVLGKPGFRCLAKLAQQVKVPLNNSTDVPQLVAALKQGAAEEQLAVARVFASLSTEGFSQSKIMEAGIQCLIPFTRVLRSESGAARAKAAAALANLASINTEVIRQTACEESLVLAAKGNSEARIPALRCLLNLTDDEDCLDGLVTAGCIPVLLSALATSSPEAQRLAASTLANVAISPKLREMIATGGAIPLLVSLLSGSNVKLQAAAAAALWQLCGEKSIVEGIGVAGGPKAAVHALQARSGAVQENAAGLVASLAQNRHNAVDYLSMKDRLLSFLHDLSRGTVQESLAAEGAVEHLLPLLQSRTTEIQAYAADALRCIAGVSDENRLLIAGSSISTLIILLGSPLPDAQLGSAGCLAALAANEEARERIGQAGAVPHLVQLLRTGKPQAKVAAATALTNLAINNSANLKEFVRAGGVAPLKHLLSSSSSSARRAAEGALSSLAVGLQSPPRTVSVGSPSSSQDCAEDPGTPSAVLLKRKSWRSPSMLLDHALAGSPAAVQNE